MPPENAGQLILFFACDICVDSSEMMQLTINKGPRIEHFQQFPLRNIEGLIFTYESGSAMPKDHPLPGWQTDWDEKYRQDFYEIESSWPQLPSAPAHERQEVIGELRQSWQRDFEMDCLRSTNPMHWLTTNKSNLPPDYFDAILHLLDIRSWRRVHSPSEDTEEFATIEKLVEYPSELSNTLHWLGRTNWFPGDILTLDQTGINRQQRIMLIYAQARVNPEPKKLSPRARVNVPISLKQTQPLPAGIGQFLAATTPALACAEFWTARSASYLIAHSLEHMASSKDSLNRGLGPLAELSVALTANGGLVRDPGQLLDLAWNLREHQLLGNVATTILTSNNALTKLSKAEATLNFWEQWQQIEHYRRRS